MAKPQLTQKEFESFINEGKTHIWQFNTLWEIDYSRNLGDGEYYLRKIIKKQSNGNLGVTRKGRFIAMTADNARYYL